ncbi:MAG: hypothetical protein K0S46_1721 [Moraxellaceae bacterium]|jgi:hypothetical protein|nr:hypothetical protein [Moraxellaceae bacterium]
MDKYDLAHEDGKWKLTREGATRATKTFETKREGVAFSTDYVNERTGSLRIRKENGQFQEERTYPRKDDPKKSKG